MYCYMCTNRGVARISRRGAFQISFNKKRLVQNPYISYVQDFCVYALRSLQNRRGFFCVFQGNRGESEASASCVRVPTHATRASHSPRFRPCSPEIRKKSRLLCRLRATQQRTSWLPLSERVYHFLVIYVSVVIDVHERQPRLSLVDMVDPRYVFNLHSVLPVDYEG